MYNKQTVPSPYPDSSPPVDCRLLALPLPLPLSPPVWHTCSAQVTHCDTLPLNINNICIHNQWNTYLKLSKAWQTSFCYKSPLLTNYALNSSFCESWLDSEKNNISIKKEREKKKKIERKKAFFKHRQCITIAVWVQQSHMRSVYAPGQHSAENTRVFRCVRNAVKEVHSLTSLSVCGRVPETRGRSVWELGEWG